MLLDNRMQVGLGSYALAWAIGAPGYPPDAPLDVFGFVQTAADLGFERVQIADNLPLHELTSDELDRLKSLTGRLELSVEVGTRGIADGNLERYLGLAAFFNSPVLRVVVDSDEHHPDPDEVVQIVREVLPQFEKAGVTLAVENHDRFTARDLRGIVRTLDNPFVGICLDTVNSFGALEGPQVVLETLGPFVVNLHIKDFTIERLPHNMGFTITGTPAGQGRLDLPWLVAELQERGRKFSGILELWTPLQATLEQTIAKERAWAEESAAYLQSLSATFG